jgi:hypothetical protein
MNISKHLSWLLSSVCFAAVISVCNAEQDTAPDVTKQVSEDWQSTITNIPQRGFISTRPADTWEQALVSGNGKYGAMVLSHPLDETIIFELCPAVHAAKIVQLVTCGKFA